MPENSEQLQIIIAAQDQASKVLQQLSGQVKKTSEDVGKFAGKTDQSNFSMGKMVAAVGLGNLAATAFSKGMGFLVNTVTSSVGAFKEAEVATAQTNAILKTMNTSLAENQVAFDKAADSALKKAFDDEGAQVALAKLYRTTRDMKFAQDSLNTAMDLARDQGIGLEEATKTLNLAFSGNVRALKQYNIELPDTASKLDVLRAVQDKVAGSADAFANTFEGQQMKLSLAFENLKETIGGAIANGLSPYVSGLTDAATRANDTAVNTNVLGKVIYQVAGAAQALGSSFIVTGKVVGVVIGSISSLVNHLKTLFGGSKDAAELSDEALKNMVQSTMDSSKAVVDGLTKSIGQGYKPAELALSKLTTTNKDYTAGVQRSINVNNSATNSIKAHKKAVEDAKASISQFQSSAIADFRKVRDSIQKDLVEETQRYNDVRAGITSDASSSIADIIVSKQDEAAELQRQINEATTDDERASLQKRLAEVNRYLDKHQQDIIDNAAAIKTIRDNDLTDEISKIKYQMQQKLALAQQEHEDKVKAINKQMDDLKVAYKKKFDEMHNALKKSKLFELFDDLENIGSKILKKKNKTPFEAGLAEFITSLTGRQFGGTVSSGQPYMVGERGPELFIPDNGGRIVPNGGSSTTNNATINITVGSVRSDQDIRAIAEQIRLILGRRSELSLKGAL